MGRHRLLHLRLQRAQNPHAIQTMEELGRDVLEGGPSLAKSKVLSPDGLLLE